MLLEHQENDIESELLKGVLPLLLYQLFQDTTTEFEKY